MVDVFMRVWLVSGLGKYRSTLLSIHWIRARFRFPPEGVQQLLLNIRLTRQDPYAQPSEPFLFPKLRNYLADFPQPPYSID